MFVKILKLCHESNLIEYRCGRRRIKQQPKQFYIYIRSLIFKIQNKSHNIWEKKSDLRSGKEFFILTVEEHFPGHNLKGLLRGTYEILYKVGQNWNKYFASRLIWQTRICTRYRFMSSPVARKKRGRDRISVCICSVFLRSQIYFTCSKSVLSSLIRNFSDSSDCCCEENTSKQK